MTGKEFPVLESTDESRINGATILEEFDHILHVNARISSLSADGSKQSPFANIKAALAQADTLINQGRSVKVLIAEGVYREDAITLRPNTQGAQALLVIEGAGKGKVVISGSDEFAAKEWKPSVDGIRKHSWKHSFGNFAYFWEGHTLVSHRSEQVFVNGKPLRQKILENYDYRLNALDNLSTPKDFVPNEWHYSHFTKPQAALDEGTFGVAEKFRNGKKIYINPMRGLDFENAYIEVSVRKSFLTIVGEKNNMILRNLVFKHYANSTDDTNTGIIIFGSKHQNFLVDACDFLWNSGYGIHFRNVEKLTVKDSCFNYNGASGIGMNACSDVILDNIETNFNCWKVFWGGQIDWYTAGAKIHETNDLLYRNSRCVGNTCPGLWFDIHCCNIIVRDSFSAWNTRNIFIELANGPYLIDRTVSVFAKHYCFYTSIVGAARVQNCLFYNNSYATLAEVIWFLREDEHATRQKIETKYHSFESNLFASGNYHTYLLGDRNFLPANNNNHRDYNYHGKHNIFYHPHQDKNFYYLNGKREFVACNFVEWQKGKQDYHNPYSEEVPTWVDPRLSDPAGLDFSLAANSPLHGQNLNLPFKKFDSGMVDKAREFFAWCGWDHNLTIPRQATMLPQPPRIISARFISKTHVLIEWENDPIADGVVLDNEWDGVYVWRNEFSTQVNRTILSFCNITSPQLYKMYSYNSLGYSEKTVPIIPITTVL